MTKKWKVEDEKIWSEKIQDWKASGLSITHFVEREGLCKSTFLHWRKTLGEYYRGKDHGRDRTCGLRTDLDRFLTRGDSRAST